MTFREIIDREDQNMDSIWLHREGMFTGNLKRSYIPVWRGVSLRAPAGVELLNLWNDFRQVVKFIDENPWVKPILCHYKGILIHLVQQRP